MENHTLDAITGITTPAARASGSSSSGKTKSISINNETQAASCRTYAGKEKAARGVAVEESAPVINMTGARNALCARFFAVGLFLSVLRVSPSQLIEHMKVLKVIGEMEASDLEAADGRKFILEFFEEGDLLHATHGGPWQYKGDAFLVEAIEAGADPSLALFSNSISFPFISLQSSSQGLWETGLAPPSRLTRT
jgi:hypothetical protein